MRPEPNLNNTSPAVALASADGAVTPSSSEAAISWAQLHNDQANQGRTGRAFTQATMPGRAPSAAAKKGTQIARHVIPAATQAFA